MKTAYYKNLFYIAIVTLSLFTVQYSLYAKDKTYKPFTQRQTPQYLSTDASLVEDTCPQHDIFNRFTCTKQQPAGFKCFDVYLMQGDPVDSERYTLLDELLEEIPQTPDPLCPMEKLTCEAFLQKLNYNLDFSWFINNFPSSSFPQCTETYSCTRIACLKPKNNTEGQPLSSKLSCVFKKNQTFFLGTFLTCEDKNNI